jgi:hypothetical protein
MYLNVTHQDGRIGAYCNSNCSLCFIAFDIEPGTCMRHRYFITGEHDAEFEIDAELSASPSKSQQSVFRLP